MVGHTEVSLDPDYPVVAVAAAKDMVVVGGQDEAVALSASDGEELWRESLADDGSGPYRATSSLVYLETATDSENYEDGEARFFDTGGEIGSLPVDVDDYGFAASSFDIADTSYLIDTNNGLLYDEDLKVLGFPGVLTPVDAGLYSADDGDLTYYEIGDSSPVWSITLGDEDDGPRRRRRRRFAGGGGRPSSSLRVSVSRCCRAIHRSPLPAFASVEQG